MPLRPVLSLLGLALSASQPIPIVSTLAGNPASRAAGHADGVATAASFNQPVGVAMDSTGTIALIVRISEGIGCAP